MPRHEYLQAKLLPDSQPLERTIPDERFLLKLKTADLLQFKEPEIVISDFGHSIRPANKTHKIDITRDGSPEKRLFFSNWKSRDQI